MERMRSQKLWRDREQEALSLAARELAVVAVRDLLERAAADQFVYVAPARVEPPEEGERFAHGQEFLQCRLLELDARLVAKARAERLAPVEHAACRRLRHAFHDLDGRRLARTVRPEQAKAPSLRNRERHAVHGADAGVLLDEIADFEHGRHGDAHAISWRA
jgi:hypothetical protein